MAAHRADNEDVDMDAVLEDHTECQQRITHLEGLVASKDAAIKTERDKIHAYTGTIKLLRDELHKQGAIRGSICERLHQLGLSVVSSAASTSSSNTAVDVRSSVLDYLGSGIIPMTAADLASV